MDCVRNTDVKKAEANHERIRNTRINVNFLSMICRQYGFLFFSVPNEGRPAGVEGKTLGAINLKKMGVLPGVSDLVIGYRGKNVLP